MYSGKSVLPLSLVLYFVDGEFAATHPDIANEILNEDQISLIRILNLSRRNKIAFSFCKGFLEQTSKPILEISRTFEKEKIRIENLKRTLEIICPLLMDHGIDFRVIKTFKVIPYGTDDIDLLLRKEDFFYAISVLKGSGLLDTSSGFFKALISLKLAHPHYKRDDLLVIDIYQGIPWGVEDPIVVDASFLWRNPRLVDVCGVKCKIPSREADFLSLIADSFFGDGNITLLDFLYTRKLINSGLQFNEILRHVDEYGWKYPLLEIISLLRNLEEKIYNKDRLPSDIDFPYMIPLHIFIKAVYGRFFYASDRKPFSSLLFLENAVYNRFLSRVYPFIGKLRSARK